MKLEQYSLASQQALRAEYPQQPLRGQVALVTGGNSGIGEGCVRHLAAAGASVGINYVAAPEAATAIVADISTLFIDGGMTTFESFSTGG